MAMHVGDALYGFTVTDIREIPGKDAQMVQMCFEKTGTELVWVKSKEANKLFSIAFKTLPEDSTGVFHILEHSVLCGSDKYPVKEPFVELLKSSMNTFLNAMTFPDKTMYPVSSRNEQDFLNLTEVYLDAVFAPKILTNPNIFYQEGWHYEVGEEGLSYNGVVFNEMKGAMSGVDGIIEQAVQDMLFPDNCYGYNSGGDPRAIPDLTYEQFLDSYRKNYHPTNARVYLDGDIPLERTLELIASYLDTFEMGTKQELTPQTPKASELTVTYEAAPEEDLTEKSHLVLSRIMASWGDKTRLLATNVLSDVLCGTNDAPLKRAILAAGLGQDVSMGVVDGVYQPWLTLQVHNMNHENQARIRELIHRTVREQVEQGLDKESLTAYINALAFRTKDMHEPQGLIRCMHAMDSWLYGGDPMLYMTYDDAIAQLREMAAGDGFEKLLRELLLEDGLNVLHAIPDLEHGQKLRRQETERLAREKSAMTSEQLEALAAQAEAFTAWQQKPDSPEELATLPVLELSQISPEPTKLPTVVEDTHGVVTLVHETPTNGIVHLTAYFALTDLTLEELSAASFLMDLLGKLPTANYDAAQLQKQIRTHLGSLTFGLESFAKLDQRDTCLPVLSARCSVLKENLPIAQKLMVEILTTTDFNQPQRIKEILLQTEMEVQQMVMMNGHRIAMHCGRAHFSASGAAMEAIGAYSAAKWIRDFAKNFDQEAEGNMALAQRILSNLACKARLTLSVTADQQVSLAELVRGLPVGTPAPAAAAYTTRLPKKLGIRIPAQVSYAGMSYSLDACGETYHGSFPLLSNILSLSCLWNAVRVQGGAYGAGMNCGRGGSFFCYSYRDPSPNRSLGAYRAMADFVEGFLESGESLDKFIISTVAGDDPLMSPRQVGSVADTRWFCGITDENMAKDRGELLRSTGEDLRRWCNALRSFAQDGAVCVVGHGEALAACEEENLTVVDI